MQHATSIPALLLCLLLCAGLPAHAQEASEPAASAPSSKVVKVEKAIQHGAASATRGVKKGVTAGVHGVERGAHAVAGGVERGARAAARGIAHGAEATARVTKKVIRKVGGTASPARRVGQPLRPGPGHPLAGVETPFTT